LAFISHKRYGFPRVLAHFFFQFLNLITAVAARQICNLEMVFLYGTFHRIQLRIVHDFISFAIVIYTKNAVSCLPIMFTSAIFIPGAYRNIYFFHIWLTFPHFSNMIKM